MSATVDMDQVLVISSWGQKWLRYAWDRVVNGSDAQQFATRLITVMDSVDEEPVHYVQEDILTETRVQNHFQSGKVVEVKRENVERRSRKIRKGMRSRFAASLSKLAYNKFGERPMSEANILVTRKWLQKYLESDLYKDLRTVDKNIAIDRALFLSFIPTNSFRMMKLAVSTPAWEKRVENKNVFSFGRVFGFATIKRGEAVLK